MLWLDACWEEGLITRGEANQNTSAGTTVICDTNGEMNATNKGASLLVRFISSSVALRMEDLLLRGQYNKLRDMRRW